MGDAYGMSSPDKSAYYAQIAASSPGRGYKEQVLAALDLRPGHTVLDVGCGPGTDLADMAEAVTETGAVIGGMDSYERAIELAEDLSAAPGSGGQPIHEWLEVRPFLAAPPTTE
jgi:cyclopropane fatty-acyl-phospholipid synthase-like methyltransferase